jgi:hypothetical protein
MINGKGYGRKRLWPNGGIIPHLSGGTVEHEENLASVAGVLVNIRTKKLPNSSLEPYRYVNLLYNLHIFFTQFSHMTESSRTSVCRACIRKFCICVDGIRC